jgi:hypothetical protein
MYELSYGGIIDKIEKLRSRFSEGLGTGVPRICGLKLVGVVPIQGYARMSATT